MQPGSQSTSKATALKRLQASVKKGAAPNVKLLENTTSGNAHTSSTAMFAQMEEKVWLFAHSCISSCHDFTHVHRHRKAWWMQARLSSPRRPSASTSLCGCDACVAVQQQQNQTIKHKPVLMRTASGMLRSLRHCSGQGGPGTPRTLALRTHPGHQ